MPLHRYTKEKNGLAIMLAANKLQDLTPEVDIEEHVIHIPLTSVYQTAHSGFETQRKHHQKTKTGISVVPINLLCPSKNFKK